MNELYESLSLFFRTQPNQTLRWHILTWNIAFVIWKKYLPFSRTRPKYPRQISRISSSYTHFSAKEGKSLGSVRFSDSRKLAKRLLICQITRVECVRQFRHIIYIPRRTSAGIHLCYGGCVFQKMSVVCSPDYSTMSLTTPTQMLWCIRTCVLSPSSQPDRVFWQSTSIDSEWVELINVSQNAV